MEIAVVGINHKTALVDIRERLAFDAESTVLAIKLLKDRFTDGEFVLLSTCNRVEIYCALKKNDDLRPDELGRFLGDFHNVDFAEYQNSLYTYHGEEAVRHLLGVASSLDSMVVGEPQISAQVKESYRLACTAGCTGKVLNKLFHCAFKTSKNIYTTTSITNRRVSVAGVAVELARQLFEDTKAAKIVVLGAGNMGELLVEHFLHIKCSDITIINRTADKGKKIAERYRISTDRWENLDEHLSGADIVVAAAATTQDYLFDHSSFAKVMDKRQTNALLVIDIAVPRNFEPSINDIENVHVYSIDDLAQVVLDNIKLRQVDAVKAVDIVCHNVNEFMEWFSIRDIGPIIGKIKESFRQIHQIETERFLAGLEEHINCKEDLERMSGRIVNKLLHCIIQNVSTTAREKGTDTAAKLAGSIIARAEKIVAEENITKKV